MKNKLTIAAVPVTLVEHIFPKCINALKKVISKSPNDISLDSIKNDLLRGDHMLITISERDQVIAVNVITSNTMPTGHKVLWIPITGGERMDEWLDDFMKLANQIALDYGCKEMRGMACRKGWLRALKKFEWYPIHEVIGCAVKQEDN